MHSAMAATPKEKVSGTIQVLANHFFSGASAQRFHSPDRTTSAAQITAFLAVVPRDTKRRRSH